MTEHLSEVNYHVFDHGLTVIIVYACILAEWATCQCQEGNYEGCDYEAKRTFNADQPKRMNRVFSYQPFLHDKVQS